MPHPLTLQPFDSDQFASDLRFQLRVFVSDYELKSALIALFD